jgi:peptide/nickel transport system ATP-binding protein
MPWDDISPGLRGDQMTVELFTIEGLTVGYRKVGGAVNTVVADVSLRLDEGEVLGLAGESGSGKSTLALAAIGYRPRNLVVLGGRARLGDRDLLTSRPGALRGVWGRRVAYVSQNAATALNPARRIGSQLAEPLTAHFRMGRAEARTRAAALLEEVGLSYTREWLRRYPHELSGGQQQRVALALALACDPHVLVLDEPTTGLDVTTQAHVVTLLQELVQRRKAGVIFVSHDLALLSKLAHRIAIMYAGQIVELGDTLEVCAAPRHPYTAALLAAVPSARVRTRPLGLPGRAPVGVVLDACSFAPRCALATKACTQGPVEETVLSPSRWVRCRFPERVAARSQPRLAPADAEAPLTAALLEAEGISCTYRHGRVAVEAVADVSFQILPGETLGIVGESGSGKTTLVRAIAGLHPPAQGVFRFRGASLASRVGDRQRDVRRGIQLVFQNPESSLNPRHTVHYLLSRPLRLFAPHARRNEHEERILELLELVKLPASFLNRYPIELSGGEKQRVALARAFAGSPSLLLCDEVTSGLDVSVQASIIELISEVSGSLHTAVILVSHDLGVVRSVASRVLVMRDGAVCEEGRVELFSAPKHPYTAALLDAIPELVQLPLAL